MTILDSDPGRNIHLRMTLVALPSLYMALFMTRASRDNQKQSADILRQSFFCSMY